MSTKKLGNFRCLLGKFVRTGLESYQLYKLGEPQSYNTMFTYGCVVFGYVASSWFTLASRLMSHTTG